MYRVLLKGCVTAKGYVSTDSKSLNKLLVVYLCFFVLVSSLEVVCFFIFFQGACHGGCVSGINHVCHVGVGIGDCHDPVWHRGELASVVLLSVCPPTVLVFLVQPVKCPLVAVCIQVINKVRVGVHLKYD